MERERPREIVIKKKVKHGGYFNIERQSFAERFKKSIECHQPSSRIDITYFEHYRALNYNLHTKY